MTTITITRLLWGLIVLIALRVFHPDFGHKGGDLQ